MTPVLRFVSGSWSFLWRQPALQRAIALLVFLPVVAGWYVDLAFNKEDARLMALLLVLRFGIIVVYAWGIACVLTVGKRLLQAKSGRLRTSLKAVTAQARGFIVPLLLTEILRTCIALLWFMPFVAFAIGMALTADLHGFSIIDLRTLIVSYPWAPVAGALLLVPPIAYLLLTVLSPLVVVYEKIAFRKALKRSHQLVQRRIGGTIVTIVLLSLLWLPGYAVSAGVGYFTNGPVATLALVPVKSVFDTFAIVLNLLSLTQFYKALAGSHGAKDSE